MRLHAHAVLSVALLLSSMMATGCVSTHMKRYIGQDARMVELDSGPPVNVMDMPDGTRAFQYYWGGGRVVVPTTTTTDGRAMFVWNEAYYTEQRITTGGFVVENPGCLITYFAKWDESAKGWIVTDIRHPKRLVC